MMTQLAADVTSSSWRDLYQIHPCAEVRRMMTDDELDRLASDIKTNGLQQSVVLWQPADSAPCRVLDGRNRLEALRRLGVEFQPLGGDVIFPDGDRRPVFRFERSSTDPASFVLSANEYRLHEHLTKEQLAERIIKVVEAGRIDCAEPARSFSPTAGMKGG